jgi:deoxyribodipyrimidine photo-lyase
LIHITLTADHLRKRWPPTQEAAWARVMAVQPESYARTRNHLEGDVTGLSPYITHGVLTLPQVLQGLLEQGPLEAGHKLVYELGWREFFRHAWAHWGSGIEASLHPGPLPDEAYATELPVDIREACTGVPAIDQAVRTLYATGYLHNHARMWLASYVVHLRRVHWRAGADWMVAHLLDGDLASNHLSWQWVAGTGSSKPYLFNAENVARFSPSPWHSARSVIDRSYEDLDRIARSPVDLGGSLGSPVEEPVLLHEPPDDIQIHADALPVGAWIVHPWALGPAPADRPVAAVFLADFHRRWAWSALRWRFVTARMAELGGRPRWIQASDSPPEDAITRADPHAESLPPQLSRRSDPAVFIEPPRRCASFSKYWAAQGTR